MNQNETINTANDMVDSLTAMSDADFEEMKAQIMEDSKKLPRVQAFMTTVFEVAERERRKEKSL